MAGGVSAAAVTILLVIAVAVIYAVVRGRKGPPPPHAADAAGPARPHDQDPVPSDSDGMPLRDRAGDPLQPGEVDTSDSGGGPPPSAR